MCAGAAGARRDDVADDAVEDDDGRSGSAVGAVVDADVLAAPVGPANLLHLLRGDGRAVVGEDSDLAGAQPRELRDRAQRRSA